MRALRITLIIVVVVGGLFVAADRVALYIAESKVADQIKSSQSLSSTPDVSIKGFPFLTQVAAKDLDEVDVTLGSVTTDAGDGHAIRLTRLRAHLHDVRISNSFSSATADRATGAAHLSYQDLSQAAGPGITVSYPGAARARQHQVRLTGHLLGFTLSAYSTVTLVNGNTIRLHAVSIPGGNIPGWEAKARQRTDFERTIDGLPHGLKLHRLTVTGSGVDVSVAGRNVDLTS